MSPAARAPALTCMRRIIVLVLALVTAPEAAGGDQHRALVAAPRVPYVSPLRPVVVAVVDSGVQADIPALAGRVLAGWDAVDGGTASDDPYSHGTAVASVIAARGAIEGIAPNALILPIRVTVRADLPLDIARRVGEAVRWAADNGAR